MPASLLQDYAYDYLSRLQSSRRFLGGVEQDRADYLYDALDRPTEQSERHGPGGAWRKTELSYIGLGNATAREQHRNGSGDLLVTKDYAHVYGYARDTHGSTSLPIKQDNNRDFPPNWGAARCQAKRVKLRRNLILAGASHRDSPRLRLR